MNTEELTIEDIHFHTIEILKKIIEICDNNNIKYFLAYGSLIGAIRHRGFIPWDDDCDVLMLRPDYDKFVSFCDSNQDDLSPFKLMNHKNTAGYPFGISRFCDTRFRMVRDEAESVGMGLFVDIYPYDGMGNGKLWEHIYINFFRTFYTRMTNYSNLYKYSSSNNKLANIIRKPLYIIAKRNGSDFYLNKLEGLANKFPFETSKYVGAIIWGIGDQHFEKGLFEDSILVDFENLMVSVPLKYDQVLREAYGDYMKLPPESERKPQHGYKIYYKENKQIDSKNNICYD